jgi:hypothetical protein
MRNPSETERVKCPDSSNQNDTWPPERVWETRGPNGDRVKYGTLKSHTHREDWTKECERTGLPVPVIDVPSKKADPESSHRPKTTTNPADFAGIIMRSDMIRAWEIHIRNEADDFIWPNRFDDDLFVEEFYERWSDYYVNNWWSCVD